MTHHTTNCLKLNFDDRSNNDVMIELNKLCSLMCPDVTGRTTAKGLPYISFGHMQNCLKNKELMFKLIDLLKENFNLVVHNTTNYDTPSTVEVYPARNGELAIKFSAGADCSAYTKNKKHIDTLCKAFLQTVVRWGRDDSCTIYIEPNVVHDNMHKIWCYLKTNFNVTATDKDRNNIDLEKLLESFNVNKEIQNLNTVTKSTLQK